MNQSLKHRLFVIIFGTNTKAGKWFDEFLLVVILLSVFAVVLESVNAIRAEYGSELYIIEWFFTIVFTIEYLLRIYVSPQPLRYMRSFFGIIDLISILPTYISIFLPGANTLLIVRLMRVLRVFRVLKLTRYNRESNILLRSMVQARQKVFVFFLWILVLTTIFGALMFVVEGPENGFTSIPRSIYWAIITITTVGYGDITPQTPFGQGIASLTMILGYSILAVPTGIITAEITTEMQRRSDKLFCTSCARSGHTHDAEFCKFCGNSLDKGDEEEFPDYP